MATATCYRHPGRETGVSCSRCERSICPDCMTPTSVGMRCPECAGDSQKVRTPAFAARASDAARATMVLIAINVGVFVVQLLFGGVAASFDGGGRLFADGALCGNAIGGGGLCSPPVVLSEGGEWWRIVTSGFLHGGIIHLALNMFVLYVLGTFLEPAIGTRRFVAVYLVSLIAGGLGALLLSDPAQNTVGASGAIYGLFGATLLIARHRGLNHVVAQLGFWLALNLVLTFGASSVLSLGGHLGGLVGGALAGVVVIAAERGRARRAGIRAELAALAALGAACFVGAVVVAGAGVSF